MPLRDNERPLLDILTHPDSVLFVGSGLSTWSDLPNWNQLLSGLMTACERRNGNTGLARDALARGDLLDAADKLSDVMTPLEMTATLRGELGFATSRPHEIHRLLTNLGPERFVTTNFDNLIEQQLGLEGRLGGFRTVTNRQVAELADIQKASANRFIFKPHGDLAEAESLVLSSAQYDRILLGSINLVRAVLETLFVSRPILFIGYGLRDPDMMLLLRSLKERYNGNAGEFWAIIAGASDELSNYWWRQHRIRVVGYPTKGLNDTDHGALLGLLRTLSDELKKTTKRPSAAKASSIGTQHGLISYAARLIRPTPAISFPIKVVLRNWTERARFSSHVTQFHLSSIADLLARCMGSFILQGPAGSGKSFAISERLSRSGRQILDWCLADEKPEPPPIPILLDARLYGGDFGSLISATVPTLLNLEEISRTHTVVLIIDSLDEMPSKYLDSGQWRSQLDSLVSGLQNVCIQFGTRRSDLVSDLTLPVFLVTSLAEEIVKKSLAELGRSTDDMTFDLVEALKTPFTLTLGRRLLGLRRDIASAPALFSKFLDEALKPLTGRGSTALILNLSELASGVLASGHDTLPIENAAIKLNEGVSRASKTPREGRWLVDRLVDAGIFVSEIDSHIRFVHRSITEFLAAMYLVDKWRRKEIQLGDVLSVRRWDNAAAWASTLLTESEAELFLREVYTTDRELALAITRSAEIGTAHIWSTLFELLIADPPTEDHQHNFIHSVEDWLVPEQALQKLKPLTKRNDAMAGWAAALMMPQMSEVEIIEWIDRVGRGELTYNLINFLGPALGVRINGHLFEYFLDSFEDAKFRSEERDSGDEQYDAISHRFGYRAPIGNLPKVARDKLLKWSRKKSAVIRGIICEGIREIDDDSSVRQYLVTQLDQGLPEAIFSLFLSLKFREGWRWWIPKHTERRAHRLIAAARFSDRHQRWALELLRCLAQRDESWTSALIRIARTEADLAVRRVLRALAQKGSCTYANRIVLRALKDTKSLAPIEREFFHLLDDFDLEIDEGQLLLALQRDARGLLNLLRNTFQKPSYFHFPIKVTHIQNWIDVLYREFSSDDWANEHSLVLACGYLAKAMGSESQKLILRRANDSNYAATDFVLGLIVPRIAGVTTDDLSVSAARRLLELYLKGKIEPFPSPGEIATERFITEIVLPRAQTIGTDRWEREAVESILLHAGRRHDRRYNPPWLHS